MRSFIGGCLVFTMLSPMSLLAEGAKPAKKAAKKSTVDVQQQLQQFNDQLTAQQSQIQQQQSQIQQLQQQLQQSNTLLQQQGTQMQSAVQQASQEAAAAQQATSNLSASVADLKSGDATLVQSYQATQKTVKDLQNPTAIHFRGVTITPGGWAESTFLVRSRNENADITSNFGSTPLGGVANSKLTEFRGSARGTRLTMLVEGNAGSTKLSGYYEIDFLGQAPTANQVQTNSFNPRQRQLFGQAEFSNGWTFTAGQFWSLVTTDRKGLSTRAEFIPTTIEGSYIIGYTYARQNAVRVTRNFNNRVWAAFEVANPETNQPGASYTPDGLFGFNNSANDSGVNGSTLNYLAGSANGFSTNLSPDLVAKAVFEPGWGHFEIKALGRTFRDRINGNNLTTYGGGLGWGMILPVVPKKVDVIFEGMGGAGIGRYGAANGSDVTIRPDGKIVPLHALHTLAGVETHPRPKLDWYVYVGDEYFGRSAFANPTSALKPAGYGSHLVNNTNCGVEIVLAGGAACGAQNRNAWDASTGFWYRIYKGPFGTFQYGMQYAYLYRGTWSGIGGAPKGIDNVVDTSVRFYLP
jgi:hypothetical protein